MKRIYLDFAATTPVKKEVLAEMLSFFGNDFGNPSSIHYFGQQGRHAVEQAREQVAKFLNCENSEIIFTSGATEANNLAIKGLVTNCKTKPHIITSAIEHHCVLDVCKKLEKEGLAEVSFIPVGEGGIVNAADIQKTIKENTLLVSIMYVNNEIGTVQPIREIGKMIEKENRDREKNHSNLSSLSQIFFHTDAVQAIEYFNHDVDYLHVDLLALSGHKIGGPKGAGALYVKKGIDLSPQIVGGGQERGLRAGTENVPAIVGLGKAIEQLPALGWSASGGKIGRIKKLRDKLINEVLKNIPDTLLNGDRVNRSPNNASFCFKFVEGESILLNLDLAGIAVSTGSACTSGNLKPSHVMLALGRDHRTAQGSIRITLGQQTTEQEIDTILEILPPIIAKLRKISPFKSKND